MVHNMKCDLQNTMNTVPDQIKVLRKHLITFYYVYDKTDNITNTAVPAFHVSFCPRSNYHF